MHNRYDIVVFDVDGTLLDTTEGVIKSVKKTIQTSGLHELTISELLTFIGPPIHDSFKRVYGLEGDILQELADKFRTYYKDEFLYDAKPYDGIYETMDALHQKGIKIAIATYKRQDYAVSILKRFGFDKYTEVMYGADFYNKLKKVDIIKKCMVELNEDCYDKALMIGDSSHDAIGAELIGMPFLGVTYGFDFKTGEDVQKYKSVGSADTPIDILKYV